MQENISDYKISDLVCPKIGDLVKWYTYYKDSIVKDAGYGVVLKRNKSKKLAPIDAPDLYDTYYVFKFTNNHNSAEWFYLEDLEDIELTKNKNNNKNNKKQKQQEGE